MGPAATICVFAKPPRAGEVKTRLSSALPADGPARLARAFFEDTWALVSGIPWAQAVLATTEPEAAEWHSLNLAEIWPQGDGDLGVRLERVLRRALETSPLAIAVGTDSPGLPIERFEAARAALASNDAVLGPCDDGGFYLIGLRRCPDGLLHELPWSAAETLECTASRLRQHGLRTALLDTWFDVDEPADLERLRRSLRAGEIDAPATARLLAELDRLR